MYQEKEKQRKLKKREENLILESQLVKDQKKSKKKKFLNIGSWIPQFRQEEKSKACFATFVELKTRFYVAIKMPDRSKNSMLEAIKQLTSNIPKKKYLKLLHQIEEKNFHAGKKQRKWEQISILQILIAHGREDAMKIVTVF